MNHSAFIELCGSSLELEGGKLLSVDGFRGILSYTQDEISFRTVDLRYKVTGSNIVIRTLSADLLTVVGKIEHIFIETI